MTIPLPGDGRQVLTIDELLSQLWEARDIVGGNSIVWVTVPGQPFHLPVSAAGHRQQGDSPLSRMHLEVLT